MPRTISDITMSKLSDFVAKEMGLLFPKEHWSDLETGMASAARQMGFPELQEFVRWLMSAPLTRQQIEKLAGFLTIGETYFFRDPRTLQVLEREILPGLLRARRGSDRRLRIWSAGCSTGEEPYTIAILLNRLLPDIREWQIAILGTDINASALRKGMDGLYGKWSFRATPPWFKHYFKSEGEGGMRVDEKVRRLVSFEYLNLAEDSYPSLATNTNAMDLILCRNVVMYFSHDTAGTVVAKLQRSLVDDGWLILGPAESAPHEVSLLEPVSLGGVICYRKRKREVPQPAPAAPSEGGGVEEPGTVAKSPLSPLRKGGDVMARALRPGGELPERQERLQPQDLPSSEPSGQSDRAEPSERLAGRKAPEGGVPAEGPSYQVAADLYRQGLYGQAAAMLMALRDRGELPGEALALLIRSQANQGKLSEALQICEETLKEEKLDPALHFLRAEILQEQGKSREAQLSLQRALYLDPKLVLAHFALGNLQLWNGEPERACRHFANAMTLLEPLDATAVVPGSEGMSAGRLREIISSMATCAGRDGRMRK